MPSICTTVSHIVRFLVVCYWRRCIARLPVNVNERSSSVIGYTQIFLP